MATKYICQNTGRIRLFEDELAVGVVRDVDGEIATFIAHGTSLLDTATGEIYQPNQIPIGVRLTVSGPSGIINWVGLTWNLPADSGVSRDITEAPAGGTFVAVRGTSSNPSFSVGSSRISIRTASRTISSANFMLRRSFLAFTFGEYDANRIMMYGLNGGPNVGERRDWTVNSTTSTVATGSSDLNMILTVPRPTSKDYLMDERFYGSYTDGGGVTYAWEKLIAF